MGFGDWFRRGDRQQPGTPSPVGAGADTGRSPEPEAGRSDSGADRRNGGRGGDWDGGWRQVAPPTVTVARSSIGVSDGLRFRDGLASWQDLAFGSELGHAVLPSAPVGLIHGVARPGAPRSESAGGPLLLRAARTGADEESEAAAGPTPATVQRTSTKTSSRAPSPRSSSPRTSSPRSSGSGASRRRAGGDGATAPEATAGAAPATSTAPAATPGPAPERAATSASQHPADTAPAPLSLQRAEPAAVRPRRIAPPLIVARRPAMALRQIAGILPPTASAPGTSVTTSTVRQGASQQTAPAVAPGVAPPSDRTTDRLTADSIPTADSATAAPVRPALGKPLRELPTGAIPSGPPAPSGVVPFAPAGQQPADMPVLQRQESDTATPAVTAPSSDATEPWVRQPSSPSKARAPEARAPQPSQPDRPGSQARARGGIGTPLPGLPSTARLRNDAPLLGDRRGTPQPGATGPQQGASGQTAPAAPVMPMPKPPNAPSEMPVRSSVVPAPPGEPAPQPAAVQRAVDALRAGKPATISASSAPAPVAPVRVRRIIPEREQGQVAGPAAGAGGSTTPVVQRSRALLAGRSLKVSTGSGEGFSGPTAGSTARPVVVPTWRRDVQQPGSDAPSPSPSLPSGPTSSRPAEPAAPHRPRGTGPGPTSGGVVPERPTPGGTVQRLVPGNPPPGPARSGTPSGRPPAVEPVRVPGTGRAAGAAPEAKTGAAPDAGPAADRKARGPAGGGTLVRLVQRAVRGGATTSPSRPEPRRPEQQLAEPRPAHRPAPPSPAPRPVPATPSASSVPSAAQPVPVVRPDPPGPHRPGATVVPVQRMPLPVVPESAAPVATGPMEGAEAALPGPPSLAVRVPQRAPAPAAGASGATGTSGASGATAEVLQRAAAAAGITGVPVRAAPVKAAQQPGRTGPAGPADSPSEEVPAANRVTAADIEELARRLLDPVSRLIRADMRRGRERTGRLYDGRR